MNYNVKGTGIGVSDELRTYLERQLAHADKFAGGDTSAHTDVELEYKEEGRSGKYRAEFTLELGGKLYRASEWGATMHEAIDLAGAELINELRVHKKKHLNFVRRSASRAKEVLRGWRRKV